MGSFLLYISEIAPQLAFLFSHLGYPVPDPFPLGRTRARTLIISLTMILLSLLLVWLNEKNPALKLNPLEWLLLISGSAVLIFSFMLDCSSFLWNYQQLRVISGKEKDAAERIMEAVSFYMPAEFDWWIFWFGEALILVAIVLFCNRSIAKKQ